MAGGADALCLLVGELRSAIALEIGEGVVLQYDQETQAVARLMVMGLWVKLAGRDVAEGAIGVADIGIIGQICREALAGGGKQFI